MEDNFKDKKNLVNIFFGDSILYGIGDIEKFGWVNRIREKKRKMLNYYYFNLGIPGQTSCDIIKRFEPELKARFNNDDAFKVIFSFGIKDALILNEDSNHKSIFKNNISNIINITKKYTQDICFVGLLDVDLNKKTQYNRNNIIIINDTLKSVCEHNNIKFIDMNGIVNIKDLTDGLHPNAIGHENISVYIDNIIYGNIQI